MFALLIPLMTDRGRTGSLDSFGRRHAWCKQAFPRPACALRLRPGWRVVALVDVAA
jgi:hypothetical protein